MGTNAGRPARKGTLNSRLQRKQAMRNLEHWHAFETRHPDTFAGMYQFWLTPKGNS
jgi:hypothetical protein